MSVENKNTTAISEEQVKTVVKKKRDWVPNPQENFGQELIKPGDNARYLRHAMVALDLPPLDLDSDEQVEERIRYYFGNCIDNDMKPTVTGLARFLGISRFTLHDWCSGARRGKSDNRTEIIRRAYDTLAELWEDYMLNGKINPVSGIFIGKNHFNYADKTEVVVTPNNPLGDMDNPDEIQQRYLESVVSDDTEDNNE